MYQGVIKDEERMRQRALVQQQTQLSSTSSTSTVQATSTPPLNTPSAPVQQPAAVIDPDCVTCVISPPPELVEAQSKEQRAAERASRMAEYEAQRGLARRLEQEQGVGETRMV
jgi:protein PET117